MLDSHESEEEENKAKDGTSSSQKSSTVLNHEYNQKVNLISNNIKNNNHNSNNSISSSTDDKTERYTPVTKLSSVGMNLEERQRQLLMKKKKEIEESTLESSSSLGLLYESEKVGAATAEELNRQKETLLKTEGRLDKINNFGQKSNSTKTKSDSSSSSSNITITTGINNPSQQTTLRDKNVFDHQQRSLGPPRSSNSSGYGTGSRRKSSLVGMLLLTLHFRILA